MKFREYIKECNFNTINVSTFTIGLFLVLVRAFMMAGYHPYISIQVRRFTFLFGVILMIGSILHIFLTHRKEKHHLPEPLGSILKWATLIVILIAIVVIIIAFLRYSVDLTNIFARAYN